MTRTNRTETYNQAGELLEVVETPWIRADYIRAIQSLEAEITPRRLRDAVLNVEGAKEWLDAKEAEIAILREELNALAND